jgi:hypothetical protein
MPGPLPTAYKGLTFQPGFSLIKGGSLPLGLPPSTPNAVFYNPNVTNANPVALTSSQKQFQLVSFKIGGCFAYSGGGAQTVPECKLRLRGYMLGAVTIFEMTISRNSYSSVVLPNTAGWQNLVGIRWDVYLQMGDVVQNSMDFALDNIVLVQDGDGSYMCAPA